MLFILISCIGLCFILKYGTIFNVPRKYLKSLHPIVNEFLECSLCIGFWCGVVIGGFCYYVKVDLLYILLPFASAGVCWFIDNVNNLIQTFEMWLDNYDSSLDK